MKKPVLLLALLPSLILSACASVPSVSTPQPVERATPPPLAKEPLGPSFLDQMQSFLSGSLPEQTNSAPPSPPATPRTTP